MERPAADARELPSWRARWCLGRLGKASDALVDMLRQNHAAGLLAAPLLPVTIVRHRVLDPPLKDDGLAERVVALLPTAVSG
jgi:hypothetical protein